MTKTIIGVVMTIAITVGILAMTGYGLATMKNSMDQNEFNVANYRVIHETISRTYGGVYKDRKEITDRKETAIKEIENEVKKLENKGYTCGAIKQSKRATVMKTVCRNKALSLNQKQND